MAWSPNADGSKHCTLCGDDFRPPRSCSCSHQSTAVPGEVRVGDFEKMLERAAAIGIHDRVTLAAQLLDRLRKSDRQAKFYLKRTRICLDEGRDADAVKWASLAEQSSGRGDKIARAYYAVVSDTERRAELERRERMAEGFLVAAPKPQRGIV